MSAIPKILNKFNRSHAPLRKFLRLVSYGCYHRTLFAKYGVTPRSYDDLLRQIRFFVPQENLQVTHHDKCSYFTFVGEFRHGTENYLYKSFLLKTLLPEQCLQKIILLQVLSDENFLSTTEILELSEDAILNHKPDRVDADLQQSFRRRLNELVNSGLILKAERAGKILYKKIPDPLNELSTNKSEILFAALKFLKNVEPIGTAGYFLCDSLKTFDNLTESAREIFRFRNNNFVRILDDDILLTITEALRRHKKILIERENRAAVTVTPVAVETDFLCSRQYLVALKRNELMRLRVDKITAIKLVNESAEEFSPAREKFREVRLRIKFQTPHERHLREKLLSDELPLRIVEESADEFICAIKTPDPLQIYPRLWKFQPWAEILPGADGLRERMRLDTLEALKNYAEPV